ncbi:MAG TPA: 30S ribosome-binding factor RbfA [Dehalococcoidia bacterium]|nr:30S ribosome-binding factor RbfA [SAR202 cluster bacterium]HAC19624.1 30S ribosome-binding factor RbfA [Dehalococcoidia bacterium]HBJ31857.1 30S ribosome-binding factor RbfA [Dehalococcoidia bacterium]HHZ62114.1 30S ribosome-binding factor RbfA [Dehalococcoidia bacterium]HIA17194.1 30S ribosome-binding factor RbfA [Dehalococcoidia bacterium]
MNRRIERINSQLRSEISKMILTDIKDPRISGVVSITRVETTGDMSYAKVFVSVYGSDTDKRNTLKAMSSARGFIQNELLHRLAIRRPPSLSFRLDETIEQGNEILELLDSLDIPPEEPTEETEQ